MIERPPRWDIETIVGWTLLVGVCSSLGLIATGFAWHWLRYGDLRFDYALPATSVARFLADDLWQATSGEARPRLLVSLGLGVLLLTPYVRVLASLVCFAVERDWTYVAVTGFVLATLTYGLLA